MASMLHAMLTCGVTGQVSEGLVHKQSPDDFCTQLIHSFTALYSPRPSINLP